MEQHRSKPRTSRRKVLKSIGAGGLSASLGVGQGSARPLESDPEVESLERKYSDVETVHRLLNEYGPEVVQELRGRGLIKEEGMEELTPIKNLKQADERTDDVGDLVTFVDRVGDEILVLLQMEIRPPEGHVRIVIEPRKERAYAVVYETSSVISPEMDEVETATASDIRANTKDIERYVVDPREEEVTYSASNCEVIDTFCSDSNCACNEIYGYEDYVEQTCCEQSDGTTRCYPDVDECGCYINCTVN